jgi:hypothetical protein
VALRQRQAVRLQAAGRVVNHGVAIEEMDLGAAGDEVTGDRSAEAAGRAGDECAADYVFSWVEWAGVKRIARCDGSLSHRRCSSTR